jgi:membrane protease subunit (stomatin/prohibitin family)
MASIQSDQVGFAKTLSDVVEEGYQWKTDRGLEIAKVAITSEYDEDTKALLSDVRKADALSGQRGNSFLQQSVARGMQAAGENGGGAMGIGMMGMGMNMAGSAMAGLQQPVGQQATEDPVTKLKQMKELLDAGVITQEEFDAAKAKFLG